MSSSDQTTMPQEKNRELTKEELAKIQRPRRSVEPNSMSYVDGKGVEHQIYLPKGTLRTASDYLVAENWEELAKFEPYTGQGYKESDYEYIKYDDEENAS